MKKLLPLLTLAAAGCATHVAASRLNARVLAQQPGTTIATPLAGAHVLMQCPDGMTLDLGTTATDGTLQAAPSTAPALDCKLTVAQTGYTSQSVSVADVCSERAANTCTALNASLLLQRTGIGSAGY